jgi:hypothetical protein
MLCLQLILGCDDAEDGRARADGGAAGTSGTAGGDHGGESSAGNSSAGSGGSPGGSSAGTSNGACVVSADTRKDCPPGPPAETDACVAGAICDYVSGGSTDGYVDRTLAFCPSESSTWRLSFGSIPAQGASSGIWEGSMTLLFAEVSGDCDDLFGDMDYDTMSHALESLQCNAGGEAGDCEIGQFSSCSYDDALVELTLSLDWAGTQWEGTAEVEALMPSNGIDCSSSYHLWALP